MNFPESRRGVSPVVAVILLVAVTVTLSAVIGGFALNLGQEATGDASENNIGVSTTQSNGQYSATIVTGSADKAKLLVNGTTVDNITNPSAGDTLTASVSPGADVTVVTITDGTSTVASSQTVSSTSTTGGTTAVAPTDGLVAHYLFDSGSGDTAIDSIGSANGTLYGNASWVPGKSETAIDFDDGSDEVRVGNKSFAETSPITVSVWINVQNGSRYGPLVAKKGSGHPDSMIIAVDGTTSPSTISAKIWNKSGTKATTTSSLSENSWMHVAFTYDESTLRLYVNGTEVDNVTHSGPLRDSGDLLRFGADEGGYTPNATVEDVRFYNRTLNDSEIQDLYDATK